MTPEIWLALGAAALLAVAAVGSGSALLTGRGWWARLAVAARLAAFVVLIVALLLAAARRGGWSPFDLQQAALSWVLATVGVHLALLAWPPGRYGAGPVVDLVALGALLVGVWVVQPGLLDLACVQDSVPMLVQWAALLLGAGSIATAGSAGLLLSFRAGPTGLRVLLKRATWLALATLGLGLAVGAWWAWWTTGKLAGDDPRLTWLAVTWLLAAASLHAWRLDRHATRWAAGLAVAAATAAAFGLLAILDLSRLLGT